MASILRDPCCILLLAALAGLALFTAGTLVGRMLKAMRRAPSDPRL